MRVRLLFADFRLTSFLLANCDLCRAKEGMYLLGSSRALHGAVDLAQQRGLGCMWGDVLTMLDNRGQISSSLPVSDASDSFEALHPSASSPTCSTRLVWSCPSQWSPA